jgi:hypothetical protein
MPETAVRPGVFFTARSAWTVIGVNVSLAVSA